MVKGFRGRGLVEGGKEPIFNFQPGTLLGKCHMMHAREVGKEKPQGLIHSNQEKRLIPRSKKGETFHVTSSGRKRIHWACQVMVVDKQPMGWWVTLKGCPL